MPYARLSWSYLEERGKLAIRPSRTCPVRLGRDTENVDGLHVLRWGDVRQTRDVERLGPRMRERLEHVALPGILCGDRARVDPLVDPQPDSDMDERP